MAVAARFAYRIDLWTDDEKEVVEHLADVDDLTVALAIYHAACQHWPGKAITLLQGRHPDAGGDARAFLALSAARDALMHPAGKKGA